MSEPAGPARLRSGAAAFRRLPKVDLHLHLEGAISPALLGRLARRHGEPAPDLHFDDFGGFLRAFGRASAQLRGAGDVALAVRDLGRRLRRDGVLHAEVFVSPTVHERRGLSWPELADGLEAGAGAVAAAGGPSLLFMADGVRQWGVAPFRGLLRQIARRPSPLLAAVGLGGDETALPARRFASAFAAARQLGLAVVVHAGEIGPAQGIREVLDELRPCRIGHGIAAVDDQALLRRLRRRDIALDVCLSSNRRTGAVPAPRPHPLPRLLAAGIDVTLGSDDPGLFRASLSGEYARAFRLGLSRRDMARLAVAGARHSLLPAAGRRRLERRLEKAWRGWAGPGGR